MNRFNFSPLILAVLILPTLSLAQLKQDGKVDMAQALTHPSGIGNIVGLFGLDPNKFSMTHSYTFSVGSFGGESYSQGLYLNTMRYQFSNPLKMYFQFGIQHQPFGNEQFQSKSQAFIAGAGLQYKPTENLSLRFEFSQTPNNYYSRGFSNHRLNYLSPFGRRNTLFDKENDSTNQ